MSKWVIQLKKERKGITPKASALTPEQVEIQAPNKKIRDLEEEKDILKKATALLMSGSLNNFR